MADVSFSMSRNGLSEDSLAVGSAVVTQGTATPGAGDIEIRISGTAGWTKNEIELAMDRLWRFLMDPGRSSNPFL